jgi:hypothetical protein
MSTLKRFKGQNLNLANLDPAYKFQLVLVASEKLIEKVSFMLNETKYTVCAPLREIIINHILDMDETKRLHIEVRTNQTNLAQLN